MSVFIALLRAYGRQSVISNASRNATAPTSDLIADIGSAPLADELYLWICCIYLGCHDDTGGGCPSILAPRACGLATDQYARRQSHSPLRERRRALYPSEHSDAISAAVVVAGIAVFPIPDIRIVAIRIVATDLWSSVPRGSRGHVGRNGATVCSPGECRPTDERDKCESSDNGLHDISPCLSDDRRRSPAKNTSRQLVVCSHERNRLSARIGRAISLHRSHTPRIKGLILWSFGPSPEIALLISCLQSPRESMRLNTEETGLDRGPCKCLRWTALE